MAVDSISGSSSTSSLVSSRATMADNFDTFLQILTTQLKNQNPLDPLDTNQFTQQLVQFTSVEQQLKTNEFMEALLANSQNSSATEAVGFIGKQVTASGRVTDLVDGQARWGVSLSQAAEVATVTITDASGNVVFTDTGAMPAGEGDYVWDGVQSDGARAPEGSYSITIDARAGTGAPVTVNTALSGVVTAIELSGSTPVLLLGDRRVALDSVTSVRSPS